jgi:hypothetical protein
LDDESKKRERSRDAPPAACIVAKAACRSARPVRRLGKGRSTGPTSGRAHLRGPHRLPGMCPSEPKQPKVFARRRWLALDYSGLREVLLERVTHPCTGSRVVYHHGITVKHSNLGLADCTSGLRTRRGASTLCPSLSCKVDNFNPYKSQLIPLFPATSLTFPPLSSNSDIHRSTSKPETIHLVMPEHEAEKESPQVIFSNRPAARHIRMVASFAEVIEREESLVAEACNHPNFLLLRFSFAMVCLAAQSREPSRDG